MFISVQRSSRTAIRHWDGGDGTRDYGLPVAVPGAVHPATYLAGHEHSPGTPRPENPVDFRGPLRHPSLGALAESG